MNFIEKYNITLQEINCLNEYENKVFVSLKMYFEKTNTLTEKQNDLLIKILKRNFDFSNIPYKKYNLYKEYYFRADYNGDYLEDSEYIIAENIDLDEKIQDRRAMQYNYNQQINRYKFIREVNVPEQITNLKAFSKYFERFEVLIKKLDKARTSGSKYKIVKALKSILTEEYNYDVIYYDSCNYKNRY